MGALGGIKDEELAAMWKAAEDAGDFDTADEVEHEFFRRIWSHPDYTNAAAQMSEKRLELWRKLTAPEDADK